MALVNRDRVLETSTTPGTGTYTLAGAVTGFQDFSVVGNGNTCHYAAWEVDGSGNPSGGWETGLGTYTTSGTTLARTTVIASSNAGAAVSWAAGTRRIAVSPLSSKVPTTDAANTFTTGKQTIQTGADGTIGLDVTGNSATQTAKLLRCLRSSGGAVRFEVDPTGYIMIDDGFNGAVIKEAGGNTIFRGIRTTAWADTQTSTFFQVGAASGNTVVSTASGNSAGRLMLDAIAVQISDRGSTAVPIPVADTLLELFLYTAETNTVKDTFLVTHESAGTPAAGFGVGQKFRLKSSTTSSQDAFELTTEWVVATHASRTARGKLIAYDTAARECIRIEASGSAPMVGFFGAAAVIQQAGTGEATGFTAGAGTTVTDQSTFTGNVGSTAYRINDVVKALKNLGLLAS